MLACNPVGPASAGRAVFLTNKYGACTDVLPAKAGPTGLLEPVRIYSKAAFQTMQMYGMHRPLRE